MLPERPTFSHTGGAIAGPAVCVLMPPGCRRRWKARPGLVRGVGVGPVAGALEDYPARGVEVLRGISFLSGSLDAVARHREVLWRAPSTEGVDPALVVGLADEFDLLVEVGTPDGVLLDADEAFERLRANPGAREDVVQALQHALTRRGTVVQP